MDQKRRIVVGVDGSAPSRSALRWALDEARRRDARVEVVHVWDYPALTYITGIAPPPTFALPDLTDDARKTIDETIEAVVGPAAPTTDLEIDRVVIQGHPVHRLLEVAQGAELLVVGHRGRGGFRDLLLGSVATGCSAHAPCPVVILREEQA